MLTEKTKDDFRSDGILLVDDEPNVHVMLRTYLEDAGYTNIHTANNGITALSLLADQEDNISVIVLDMKMPGLDGFDVIKHLTNVHVFPVGIVMFTGYGSAETAQEFFSMGNETVLTTQYLTKPLPAEEFITEIQHTLHSVRKKREASQNINATKIKEAINSLEAEIKELQKIVADLRKSHRGFVTELGLDVLRAILIAAAFIAILYFDIGNFLHSVISGKHSP